MTVAYLDVKGAYLDWFRRADPQFAYTASAKQGLSSLIGPPRLVTVDELSKNVARVMERVSRDVFGRSEVRKGTRLQYCGCVEGDRLSGKRLHVHLAVSGLPAEFDIGDLIYSMDERWRTSRWGYRSTSGVVLEPGEAEGWYKYLLKDFSTGETERWFANF